MTEEEKKKGLARLNPADTYREAFAQAVTPSNEIDYTRSNADRIIKDYQESELAGVVNSIKPEEGKTPVVDEDVRIIDTTVEYEPPTEEMRKFEEEKTQAQWEKDYFDSIWSKEDEEAAEKKKKAAQWITAAQMLGDSLTALGNSYFVAKGANNMGASQGAAKAAEATSKLYQDIREARERAAKAKYELEKARKEWEYRKEKDKQAQDNWQKTFDANGAYRAQQQKNFEKTEARLAEQAKINAENKNKPEMFLLDEGWVSVPKEKWTDTEVAAVYAKIPKEIRESIEKVVTDEGYGRTTSKSIKPTPQQMRQWIGEYKHHPEVADAIRRLAGVEPIAPKEGEVKSEVVVDPLTGKSYSVNPENPVIGGTQKKKPNPMNS